MRTKSEQPTARKEGTIDDLCRWLNIDRVKGRRGLKELKDMTQAQFYKTPAWRKCRAAYIARRVAIDGGLCEMCGRDLGKVVHHYKVWLDDINCNDPTISLNPANLRYECQTCHNQEPDPRKPGRRYLFDRDGNVISAEGMPPIDRDREGPL